MVLEDDLPLDSPLRDLNHLDLDSGDALTGVLGSLSDSWVSLLIVGGLNALWMMLLCCTTCCCGGSRPAQKRHTRYFQFWWRLHLKRVDFLTESVRARAWARFRRTHTLLRLFSDILPDELGVDPLSALSVATMLAVLMSAIVIQMLAVSVFYKFVPWEQLPGMGNNTGGGSADSTTETGLQQHHQVYQSDGFSRRMMSEDLSVPLNTTLHIVTALNVSMSNASAEFFEFIEGDASGDDAFDPMSSESLKVVAYGVWAAVLCCTDGCG